MKKRIKPNAVCRCVPALIASMDALSDTIDDEADESIGYIVILAKFCVHEGGVLTLLRSNMDPEDVLPRIEVALKLVKPDMNDKKPNKPHRP
jgi:hypothetical protein